MSNVIKALVLFFEIAIVTLWFLGGLYTEGAPVVLQELKTK